MSNLSFQSRLKVFKKTNSHCSYCGDFIGTSFDADHVVPLKRGGPTTVENMVPACRLCNLRKRARSLEEFRRFMACGGVSFDQQQIDFLNKSGHWYAISLFIDRITSEYKFWFERVK